MVDMRLACVLCSVHVYSECTGVSRPTEAGCRGSDAGNIDIRGKNWGHCPPARHCTLELGCASSLSFVRGLGMLLYLLHQARIHNIVSESASPDNIVVITSNHR